MAQPRRSYTVGDYIVGAQIGAGSFSTVWHGHHRLHGTEVAIKEIVTSRLNSKLQESLKSEIFILKRINHPNIIRLHDMMEEPGKIYIVLEYCKGGDLSIYIQKRHGKVPEATAKHFMQQLAKGLKILRENNLIHRDLKPQNLLLTSNDDSCILKIADFGFARSLQPRGLAETLCGSPLYMAPEIMQLQKYDAKADLWSVGAILFQLVIGKTPFTGNNQIQLLQNIMKSTELSFPPEAKNLSPHLLDLCRKLLRRNPVERLTFEEFFNHPYLSDRQPAELFRNRQSHRIEDDFPHSTAESSQEDCLPFILDYDSSIPDCSPSPRKSTIRSLDLDSKDKQLDKTIDRIGSFKYNSSQSKTKLTSSSLKDSLKTADIASFSNNPKVEDSLEFLKEYVIVSGPPLDLSSSGCASNFPSNVANLPLAPANIKTTNSSVAQGSTPTTSRESVNIPNISVHPSTDCMSRIKSLQHCASSLSEIVNEMTGGGKRLEAFSVLLVVLAIWKQALHICHTCTASGNSSQETSILRQGSEVRNVDTQELQDISSHIEREFLLQVENAEELAKVMDNENTEMPDAMELIYQSALSLGRRGAVDEYMGAIENAMVVYSKAVSLLQFLLVEAPSLVLNPPFSLTASDRYRIKNYIDVLTKRHNISQSQRMALLSNRPS